MLTFYAPSHDDSYAHVTYGCLLTHLRDDVVGHERAIDAARGLGIQALKVFSDVFHGPRDDLMGRGEARVLRVDLLDALQLRAHMIDVSRRWSAEI